MAHRFSRVNIDAADGWADKGAGPEHSVELSGRSLRSFIRVGHGGRGLGDAERGGAGGGTGANARAQASDARKRGGTIFYPLEVFPASFFIIHTERESGRDTF